MEELDQALAGIQVTYQPNSTAAEFPFHLLYKGQRPVTSQEDRRKNILNTQKKNRDDYVNHLRKLATNEWTDKNEFKHEHMDVEENIPRKPPKYRDQLMLSEWLVEVPCDLKSNWLLVLCPSGRRNLVVASRGATRSYSKSGYLINTFPSYLPGGNRANANRDSILDCIYNELDKTYYVLDVMSWNSHPCSDSETVFRFAWVNVKINEDCPEILQTSPKNPYKFVPVPHYACDKLTIKKALESPLPFPAKLDGLLFYHKEALYSPGTTPLVGWLKGYMVPELLGIEVPTTLLQERPASYENMRKHIPKAFEDFEKRKQEEENAMQ